MINTIIHPEALDLAELLKPKWDEALEQLRRSGVPLLAGDVDDDAVGGDDGGSDDTEEDAAGDDDFEHDASGGGDDGDDDIDDDTTVRVDKNEYNRLKREQAEAAKARRKAERDAKKARERERKEAGQYDEILAEKDEEVSAAAARAEAAEYQLEQFQRRHRITAAATRLGFKDPEDAIRFLDEDDTDDDVMTERALKRLAREKRYLIDERRSSGAPVNGERGVSLSHEDIKKMSQDEINNRWEEVQAALAQGTS
jgi:hypothetical protein